MLLAQGIGKKGKKGESLSVSQLASSPASSVRTGTAGTGRVGCQARGPAHTLGVQGGGPRGLPGTRVEGGQGVPGEAPSIHPSPRPQGPGDVCSPPAKAQVASGLAPRTPNMPRIGSGEPCASPATAGQYSGAATELFVPLLGDPGTARTHRSVFQGVGAGIGLGVSSSNLLRRDQRTPSHPETQANGRSIPREAPPNPPTSRCLWLLGWAGAKPAPRLLGDLGRRTGLVPGDREREALRRAHGRRLVRERAGPGCQWRGGPRPRRPEPEFCVWLSARIS